MEQNAAYWDNVNTTDNFEKWIQEETTVNKITSIKKGDWFKCIRTVIMYGSGITAYIAGKFYKSEYDRCITDEQDCKEHLWNADVNDFFDRVILNNTNKHNPEIAKVSDSLHDLLQYKNNKYGSSGLTPINVFSKTDAETGLLQRIDDKIARIKNSPELRKNDVADLIGYLILLCVTKDWNDFNEFKD